VRAFAAFHASPLPAVYNLGGGRSRNVSMLEAIELSQRSPAASSISRCRTWRASAITAGWISDLDAFEADIPPGS